MNKSEIGDGHENQLVKRAWSDLTKQGWGKRSWTQLHGAWGKRRWDQLHGAWGKRAPLDGQQSEEVDEDVVDVDDDDDSSLETDQVNALEKRSGWNKMQGVWGKRSGVDNNDVLVTVDDDYQRDDDNLRDDSAQVKLLFITIVIYCLQFLYSFIYFIPSPYSHVEKVYFIISWLYSLSPYLLFVNRRRLTCVPNYVR